MDIARRNNVSVLGQGSVTLLMAHGYGCDQNMWKFMAPKLADRFRVVLFDYVGSGESESAAYDPVKYSTLDGYASDLVEVARAQGAGSLVLIGHSVSAMIGLLADKRQPGIFDAHVMIGPSPSYINQDGYVGGFEQSDIDELLTTLEGNYLGWSSNMAPAIMGNPDKPELTEALTNSFCKTDPSIAARFARATFLSNNLADLPGLVAPTLILQSADDFIAPQTVGRYLQEHLPNARLRVIDNTGHCPHMSAADACVAEIDLFLHSLELEAKVA